jgi:NAD(P)-dependent dehydrogenase (short-subunit alcohol dehydrogenase family)
MFTLEGRVAVITGAGSGIGQRIAVGFADAGAKVVLVDINQSGLDETVGMLGRSGNGDAPLPVACDVSSEDQVLALFDTVNRRLGRVDVLVNGAFTPVLSRPQSLDLDSWQRALRVNLTGYFLCARAAGQAMIDADRGGSIINISSIAGVSGLGRRGSSLWSGVDMAYASTRSCPSRPGPKAFKLDSTIQIPMRTR